MSHFSSNLNLFKNKIFHFQNRNKIIKKDVFRSRWFSSLNTNLKYIFKFYHFFSSIISHTSVLRGWIFLQDTPHSSHISPKIAIPHLTITLIPKTLNKINFTKVLQWKRILRGSSVRVSIAQYEIILLLIL